MLIGFGQKLGIESSNLGAWYSIRNRQLIAVGGSGLLQRYRGSLSRALRATFPEHPWDDSKFLHKPRNYWDSRTKARELLNEIAVKFGVAENDYDAWYKVSWRDLTAHGAKSLLQRHGGSISKLLSYAFPEHKFEEFRFVHKPRKFFEEVTTSASLRPRELDKGLFDEYRTLMVQIGEKLGIGPDNLDLWYNFTADDLRRSGGQKILHGLGKSMPKILSLLFPEKTWESAKFVKRPKDFWRLIENQREFMESLGKRLGFAEDNLSAWYGVRIEDIVKHGGARLLVLYGRSPIRILQSVFPDHVWDPDLFVSVSPKHKRGS